MKILREVSVKERLPNEEGRYFIIMQGAKSGKWYNPIEDKEEWVRDIEYWFEEVKLDLKSEEILPKNRRHTLEGVSKLKSKKITLYDNELIDYITALEAAELEIAELKASKSAIRSNKKYIEQTVLKGLVEDNERLSKNAKERYNHGLKIANTVKYNNNWWITIQEALKIAAYGTNE